MSAANWYVKSALLFSALSLLGLGSVGSAPTAVFAQAKAGEVPPAPKDVNDLSMEVAVLRTLYLFKADPSQLKAFKDWAKDCAQKPRQREMAEVSDSFRKTLTELRSALIKGDEEQIGDLSDQLEELRKHEDVDLDDAVDVSDEARKFAPRVRKRFSANQHVAYLAAYGKDFPNDYRQLCLAMRLPGYVKGKKPKAEQWPEIRKFACQEAAWHLGGLDKAQAKKIEDDLSKLLDRAYALSPEQLQKQRDELAQALGKIFASAHADPMETLKNVTERDVAEMISNPRFLAAVAARLQYLQK